MFYYNENDWGKTSCDVEKCLFVEAIEVFKNIFEITQQETCYFG